jgi:hypothetical protein
MPTRSIQALRKQLRSVSSSLAGDCNDRVAQDDANAPAGDNHGTENNYAEYDDDYDEDSDYDEGNDYDDGNDDGNGDDDDYDYEDITYDDDISDIKSRSSIQETAFFEATAALGFNSYFDRVYNTKNQNRLSEEECIKDAVKRRNIALNRVRHFLEFSLACNKQVRYDGNSDILDLIDYALQSFGELLAGYIEHMLRNLDRSPLTVKVTLVDYTHAFLKYYINEKQAFKRFETKEVSYKNSMLFNICKVLLKAFLTYF